MSINGVQVSGPVIPGSEVILTPQGLEHIAVLNRTLNSRRLKLLKKEPNACPNPLLTPSYLTVSQFERFHPRQEP